MTLQQLPEISFQPRSWIFKCMIMATAMALSGSGFQVIPGGFAIDADLKPDHHKRAKSGRAWWFALTSVGNRDTRKTL